MGGGGREGERGGGDGGRDGGREGWGGGGRPEPSVLHVFSRSPARKTDSDKQTRTSRLG